MKTVSILILGKKADLLHLHLWIYLYPQHSFNKNSFTVIFILQQPPLWNVNWNGYLRSLFIIPSARQLRFRAPSLCIPMKIPFCRWCCLYESIITVFSFLKLIWKPGLTTSVIKGDFISMLTYGLSWCYFSYPTLKTEFCLLMWCF